VGVKKLRRKKEGTRRGGKKKRIITEPKKYSYGNPAGQNTHKKIRRQFAQNQKGFTGVSGICRGFLKAGERNWGGTDLVQEKRVKSPHGCSVADSSSLITDTQEGGL